MAKDKIDETCMGNCSATVVAAHGYGDGDRDEDDGYAPSHPDYYDSGDDESEVTSYPVNTAAQQPVDYNPDRRISVYIKDTEAQTTTVGIGADSDIIEFSINFAVSCYGGTEGSKNYTVTKKISVSKANLLAQGQSEANSKPAQVLEQIQETPKFHIGKSDLQRMREIAGVPHNKNYV